MSDRTSDSEEDDTEELALYSDKCRAAWDELFNLARGREELQFAMSLNSEFRGWRDAGWSAASASWLLLHDALNSLDDIRNERARLHFALSLYAHLSEASGLYEVPKNMLNIASGESYSYIPFQHLSERRRSTGIRISPNSNKIMADLLGHAEELNLQAIRAIILETFDPDLRNGYAHADFIFWNDGIRLPRKNGGPPRIVPYKEFFMKLNKSINFFESLNESIYGSLLSFSTPRIIIGRTHNSEPIMQATIHFDTDTKTFTISI